MDNRLAWREDSSNTDLSYRRNEIRHKVLTRFSPDDRQKLHDIIFKMRQTNNELDMLLGELLGQHAGSGKLDRRWFIMLPHAAAREVMAAWLREHQVADIDRQMVERLVHAGKTYAPGQRIDINHNDYLFVGKHDLALSRAER
jgi:tRNA(Ile)-lysidine synthase TilS/MesJ